MEQAERNGGDPGSGKKWPADAGSHVPESGSADPMTARPHSTVVTRANLKQRTAAPQHVTSSTRKLATENAHANGRSDGCRGVACRSCLDSVVHAQLTVLNSNVPASFAISGFIQAATLKPGGASNAGGTLTVNNITMIVPDNSIVQLPANSSTWAELFDVTPVGAGIRQCASGANHPADQPSGPNALGQPMTGLALRTHPRRRRRDVYGIFPILRSYCRRQHRRQG